MTHQPNVPFRFMSYKEWVPDALGFWIYILFLICFQFSNGMYFTAMTQMQGDLAITLDDTKMLGYAVLVGLTMYFPLAFRLKFRFTNRTCLLIASAGLAVCNIIVPHVESMPLLVVICFIAGFFRLFGTFECLSSMLPKIAPTYNYAVFLSFVFFVVLGFVHVFDIITSHIIYYYDWHYVHHAAVAMSLIAFGVAFILMQPFRPMPKMPLFGIDWMGFVLWSVFILTSIFVVQYGNQLDWLNSPYIRIGIGVAILALATNLWRMFHTRHPYLEFKAFRVRNVGNLLLLFLFLSIMLAPKTVLQNIFTSAIMHMDYLSTANLKWWEFIGILLGAVFSWYTLAKLRMSRKLITFVGMFCVVVYSVMMYFNVSSMTQIECLYLPLVVCGFGHVIVFIALTVYIQASAPFKNYFQILCILGFVRTGIGSPIGDAIYSHAFTAQMSHYIPEIGINDITQIELSRLSTIINSEAIIASVRELFGWSVMFGTVVLIIIMCSRFKGQIIHPMPTLRKLYKIAEKTVPRRN